MSKEIQLIFSEKEKKVTCAGTLSGLESFKGLLSSGKHNFAIKHLDLKHVTNNDAKISLILFALGDKEYFVSLEKLEFGIKPDMFFKSIWFDSYAGEGGLLQIKNGFSEFKNLVQSHKSLREITQDFFIENFDLNQLFTNVYRNRVKENIGKESSVGSHTLLSHALYKRYSFFNVEEAAEISKKIDDYKWKNKEKHLNIMIELAGSKINRENIDCNLDCSMSSTESMDIEQNNLPFELIIYILELAIPSSKVFPLKIDHKKNQVEL